MSFNQSLNSDIEYFDITVSNLNSTSTASNPILQFNETRANPFISDTFRLCILYSKI
jgi:hypothetical protein